MNTPIDHERFLMSHYDRTEATQELVIASPPRQSRRTYNGAILFVIVASLVSAVGLLYLLQTNHVSNLGYEISRLQNVQTEQKIENRRLSLEISGYQTLDRIERTAVGHGMKPMDSYEFISVSAPLQAEITVPNAEKPAEKSILSRIWNRISGEGQASSVYSADDVQ